MTKTSPSNAQLVAVRVPTRARAHVVVLHGGASRGEGVPVSATQLSVLRMIPVARRVARTGHGGLAVWRLLNSARGWSSAHSPIDDARWALDTLAAEHGTLPAGLVGHSLGGRAALLAAVHPDVRAVVALNPWVYPTDDADLTGRAVLVVHGSEDRIASPERARVVTERLARHTDARFEEVAGGKHAMLSHGSRFEKAAADFLRDHLLAEPGRG